MKFIFVLVCVVAAVIGTVRGDEVEEKFKEAHEKCVKKSGASEEAITKAKEGHFKDGDNMGCFAECVFQEVGFVTDGKLNLEAMKGAAKATGGAKHVEAAEKCSLKSGSDMCDTAHQVFRCFYETVNA